MKKLFLGKYKFLFLIFFVLGVVATVKGVDNEEENYEKKIQNSFQSPLSIKEQLEQIKNLKLKTDAPKKETHIQLAGQEFSPNPLYKSKTNGFGASLLATIKAHPKTTFAVLATAFVGITAAWIYKHTKAHPTAKKELEDLIARSTKDGKFDTESIAEGIVRPFIDCMAKMMEKEEEEGKKPNIFADPQLFTDAMHAFPAYGENLVIAFNKLKKITTDQLDELETVIDKKINDFSDAIVKATPTENQDGTKDTFKQQHEFYGNFFDIFESLLRAKAKIPYVPNEHESIVNAAIKAKKLKVPFNFENIHQVAKSISEGDQAPIIDIKLEDVVKINENMAFITSLWSAKEAENKDITAAINPEKGPIDFPKLAELVAKPMSDYAQKLIDEGTDKVLSAETLEKAFHETGTNLIIAARANYEVFTAKGALIIHRGRNFQRAFNAEFEKARDIIASKFAFLSKYPENDEKTKVAESLNVFKKYTQMFKVFFTTAKNYFKTIEEGIKADLLNSKDDDIKGMIADATKGEALKDKKGKDLNEKQIKALVNKFRKALKKSKGITKDSLIEQALKPMVKGMGLTLVFDAAMYATFTWLSSKFETSAAGEKAEGKAKMYKGLAARGSAYMAQIMGTKLLADLMRSPRALREFLEKHHMKYLPEALALVLFPAIEKAAYTATGAGLEKLGALLSTMAQHIDKNEYSTSRKMLEQCNGTLYHLGAKVTGAGAAKSRLGVIGEDIKEIGGKAIDYIKEKLGGKSKIEQMKNIGVDPLKPNEAETEIDPAEIKHDEGK